MKSRSVFLLALLFYAGATLAQTGKIEFKESMHDFGTIPESGGEVSHLFEFTNSGDAPIIIQSVSTSCGCTASEWTHEPILPGKTGTIKATYNPMGRPNTFTKTLTVRSNGEPQSTVLFIKGNVTPRERTPEEIYTQRYGDIGMRTHFHSLGRVPHNSKLIKDIEIYNFAEKPITLSATNLPSYISVQPKHLKIKGQTLEKLTFTVDGSAINEWGFITVPFSMDIPGQTPKLTLAFSREEDFSNLTPQQRVEEDGTLRYL